MMFAAAFSHAARARARRCYAGTLAGSVLRLSSPSSRFYTLGGDSAAPACLDDARRPRSVSKCRPSTCRRRWRRTSSSCRRAAAQVQVLEEERWASLPGDEIRRALSTGSDAAARHHRRVRHAASGCDAGVSREA